MNQGLSVIELVGGVFGLLLLAAATLALAQRIRVVPFTVLLVAVGIGLVELGKVFEPLGNFLGAFKVSDAIILYVFLPSLLYESAYNLNARQLRQNLAPVLTLAVPGLLISTGLIGVLLWKTTGLNLPVSLLLGAVLSATDPVAVIAIFKQLGAPKRLTVLVEGESLFNDATAVVLANILIKAAVAAYVASLALTPELAPQIDVVHEVTHGSWHFFKEFFGGALLGWLAAVLTGAVLGRIDTNAEIEISLTIILAYLSFLVAQHVFHFSGVMAVVAAGVTMGGPGRTKISPAVAGFMEHLWEYVAFVSNALIFLLVGLQVSLSGIWDNKGILMWTIVAMLGSRALVVYGLTPLVTRWTKTDAISMGYRTVMYWGGLRGAIALAIVLSLPELQLSEDGTTILRQGFDPEFKQTLVTVVTGAVLFTLLGPGLTIEALVKKLGLSKPPLSDRIARLNGLISAKNHALANIPALRGGGLFSLRIAKELEADTTSSVKILRAELDELRRSEMDREEERRILLLRCLGAEKTCYYDMFTRGHITELGYRDLAHSVELQSEAVRHRGELPSTTLYARPGPLRRMLRSVEPERRRIQRIAREYEETWARHQGCEQVLTDLVDMAATEATLPEIVVEVRTQYENWEKSAAARLDSTAEQFPEFVSDMQERLAKRLLIHAETKALRDEERAGTLPGGVSAPLLASLAGELRGLRGEAAGKLRVDPSELLRKVPFFVSAAPEEFSRILALLQTRTVPAGETIIRLGDSGDSLFLISRGVVRVSIYDESAGQERDLATLLAGDFFGEMAFLRGEPRTANCRAVTPCAIHELRRRDFDAIQQSCPAIRDALEDADRIRASEVSGDSTS